MAKSEYFRFNIRASSFDAFKLQLLLYFKDKRPYLRTHTHNKICNVTVNAYTYVDTRSVRSPLRNL